MSNYYPRSAESADNASAVEIVLNDRQANSYQLAIEITAGAALAGTMAVAVVPFGASAYQTLTTSFDCTAPVPAVVSGRFQKIKFTPASLTAGTKFTAYVDRLDIEG